MNPLRNTISSEKSFFMDRRCWPSYAAIKLIIYHEVVRRSLEQKDTVGLESPETSDRSDRKRYRFSISYISQSQTVGCSENDGCPGIRLCWVVQYLRLPWGVASQALDSEKKNHQEAVVDMPFFKHFGAAWSQRTILQHPHRSYGQVERHHHENTCESPAYRTSITNL